MDFESDAERNGFMIFLIVMICIIFVGIISCSIYTYIYGEDGNGSEVPEEIQMEAGGFVDQHFIDQKNPNLEIGGI